MCYCFHGLKLCLGLGGAVLEHRLEPPSSSQHLLNSNTSPLFILGGVGCICKQLSILPGAPPDVLWKGNTQPFTSNCSWKHSFNGKPSCLGRADWQDMSPRKIFSTYKARRMILLSYARNNKDKLLNNCGMPNVPLRQSPNRQEDQTECRRPGNIVSLK